MSHPAVAMIFAWPDLAAVLTRKPSLDMRGDQRGSREVIDVRSAANLHIRNIAMHTADIHEWFRTVARRLTNFVTKNPVTETLG